MSAEHPPRGQLQLGQQACAVVQQALASATWQAALRESGAAAAGLAAAAHEGGRAGRCRRRAGHVLEARSTACMCVQQQFGVGLRAEEA